MPAAAFAADTDAIATLPLLLIICRDVCRCCLRAYTLICACFKADVLRQLHIAAAPRFIFAMLADF